MSLDMERVKTPTTDQHPATTDSQTDTDDLELAGVPLTSSGSDGGREALTRGASGGTGDNEVAWVRLEHTQSVRAAAVQLRRLLNTACPQVRVCAKISRQAGRRLDLRA